MTRPNVTFTAPLEPLLLKIRGGWINPNQIRYVQAHPNNKDLLIVSVEGIDQPIPLDKADSDYLREYLEGRTWLTAKQAQAMAEAMTQASEDKE